MQQADPYLTALDRLQSGKRPTPPPVATTEGPDEFLEALDRLQSAGPPPSDSRSAFARAYDWLFTAPEAVTSAARSMANRIDEPSEGRSRVGAMVRGGIAGALEGAAGLLTPGDAALTVTGTRAAKPLLRAARVAPEAMRAVQQAANVATVARGGERMMTAESPSDALAGIAQVSLGTGATAANRRVTPKPPARQPVGELPPAPFVSTPDGVVLPPGASLPEDVDPYLRALDALKQGKDPSFVRGVPAQVARREIRGLLPPHREAIALPPPPDASGVKAVPAAVVDRERVSGRVRQFTSDPEIAESVAPPERVPARRTLDADEAAHLARLKDDARARGFTGSDEELDAIYFDKREQAHDLTRELGENDETSILSAVAELGGISMTTESQGGRLWGTKGELKQLFESMDYGTDATGHNRRTGAPRATRYYQQGGLRGVGPIVTQLKGGKSLDGMAEALRERGFDVEGPNDLLDKIESALVRFRADSSPKLASTLEGALDVRVGGGWFREPEDQGFDAFSAAFDEIVARGDESGFARTDVLTPLATSAAGAATGGALIEDDDPYWKRAAKIIGGAAVGGALPIMFKGRGGRLPEARATVLPMAESARVPRVGATGKPMADPLAGVETFLDKFSNPLVRDGIKERLIANGGFAEQRRQSIDAGQVGRLAAGVRVDVSKALPRGSAASAEVIAAYARGLRQSQERIADLAAKVNNGTATDADVLALEIARADSDVILKSLMGLRGEAGRALGVFRSLSGMFDTGNVEIVRGAAQQLRDDAAKFAREFAELPNDSRVRYEWLKKQGQSTNWDKFRSYWYANLLSGVKTHERNILGNVFNAVGNLAAHPVSAGVDVMRHVATGAPRQVFFSELPHGVMGAFAGMERGLSDAIFTLRHGITPHALSKGLQSAEVGKFDLPRVEFAGGAANPFNAPGRVLDAADVFFRSVARHAEMYEAAYAAARSEGLSGDALKRRMEHLLTGSSPEAVALREQAEHVAARAVFQEKGGPITSFLAQGYKVPIVGQAMTFTIPFLRTPGNILRQGLEASPVGFAMREARRGGRAGALAQGKATAGSFAAATLAWLASTGQISGNGPKDPKERAALMESGWRPNSIRIGDQWVSYQLFQPVSVQAAIFANAYEAWRDGGGDEQSAVDLAGQTLTRALNSFTEQSFLSGLSDLQQAINDPERFGSRWLGRTAQGLSPFAGMQRTIQQGMDPVVRKPDTALEHFKSATPGLSTSVPARLDRFGEDIIREGGPVRRMADPFNTSSVKRDLLSEELERIGVSVPQLSTRMKLPGGRVLTEDEEQRVKQEQGRLMRAAIAEALQHPNYHRWPDDVKQKEVESAISRARAEVARRVRQDVIRGRGVFAK